MSGKTENSLDVACISEKSQNVEVEKAVTSDLTEKNEQMTEGKQGVSFENIDVRVATKMEAQKIKKIHRKRKKSIQENCIAGQASESASKVAVQASESASKAYIESLNTPMTESELPNAPKPQEVSKKKKRRNMRKRNQAKRTKDGKDVCIIYQEHTNNEKNGEEIAAKKMELSPKEEDVGLQNQDPHTKAVLKRKRRRQRKKKPVKDSDRQTGDIMANTSPLTLNSQPAKEEETPVKSETTAGSFVLKSSKKRKRRRRNKNKKDNQVLGEVEVGGAEKLSQETVDQPGPEDDGNTQPKKKRKIEMDRNITETLTTISIEVPKLGVAHMKRKDSIRESWNEDRKGGQLWQDTRVEVIKDPFTCCYLPNFLSDPTYLSCVKEELADLELITKNNDLYKFHQTSDLRNVVSPYIAGLRHFLYGEFREWLKQVTGIPLNDKVDMGCSSYEYTDVLLCHDDELEGRRIAYILYLVPPWSQEDGGTLDLFTIDEHGQPSSIVRSLVPEWNAFAFFEVSPVSFHQVSEVLSQDKVRLSINGWFHGPPVERPERHLSPPTQLLPGHVEEEEVYAWVNHIYLDQGTQQKIRQKFRTESAIELENFVTDDKYEELSMALKAGGLPWERIGPPNKQSVQTLSIDRAPEVVTSCAELLKSEAMFLILSQLTGLKLHHLVPPDSEPDSDDENGAEPNARTTLSIHCWGHGNYTLVRDDCVETVAALDAHLFVNVAESWSQEQGGFISYITKDEDEELLTVIPRANCLAIVYRDAETLKFTKHINASVAKLGEADTTYHTFSSVYYE